MASVLKYCHETHIRVLTTSLATVNKFGRKGENRPTEDALLISLLAIIILVGMNYVICDQCSLFIPVQKLNGVVCCDRCRHQMNRFKPKSVSRTIAFSITALIFYIPANMFPFMTMELYGSRNSTTIWNGITSLIDSGNWTVGIIVFLASILIPLLKLIILFYLALTANNGENPRTKTQLFVIVESLGRWSMLDIFLLAVLVALIKIGGWTSVQPEVGSLLFAFVVVFTMLASASFDSRLLWRGSNAHH